VLRAQYIELQLCRTMWYKRVQICNLAMPDASKAASVLKDSLPTPPDWALLCCCVHLLKLVIRAQCGRTEGTSVSDQEQVQARCYFLCCRL
jgi:hypothetical protein